jgi:syndecan 4
MFSSAAADAVTCEKCAAGAYASATATTSCDACVQGQFSAMGAAYCTSCPTGQYSILASQATSCTAYCGRTIMKPVNNTVKTIHESQLNKNLAPGRYSNATGASAPTTCSTCPAGSYSAGGASSCTSCAAGYYQVLAGAKSCGACGIH